MCCDMLSRPHTGFSCLLTLVKYTHVEGPLFVMTCFTVRVMSLVVLQMFSSTEHFGSMTDGRPIAFACRHLGITVLMRRIQWLSSFPSGVLGCMVLTD